MSSLCKAVGTSFRLGGGGGKKMLVSITSNPFVVIYQNNTILYSSVYVILVTTQILAYFSLLLYTDQCIYCHFFLCLEKYAPLCSYGHVPFCSGMISFPFVSIEKGSLSF